MTKDLGQFCGWMLSVTPVSSSTAMSVQEAYQQVTAGYRMPAPAKCPHFLYQIMLKCWAAEPDDRPDFRTLKVQLDNILYELE